MSEIEHVPASPVTRDPVRELRVAIGSMIDEVAGLAEAGDWESLVRGLAPLQQVIGDLRIIENDVKRHVADLIPERRVSVDGVHVEKKAKITRKGWRSAELLRSLVFEALVDPDTGEIPASPIEAVEKVMAEVEACVPFTGSTGWRVGALRDRGYDIDEWCDENFDGWSLQVTRDRSEG
jgi:hypothetical protein